MPGHRLCTRLTLDDFLCFNFNGPTGVTVAPDDTRANFFHHMGLSEGSYRHRVLYRKMKQEAKVGMRRLFETRNSLQSELIEDETVQTPFSVYQIAEIAFQHEIEKIYDSASAATKGIYDLTRTDQEGNWVIRWMLWHVIQAKQIQPSPATSTVDTEYSVPSLCPSNMEYSTLGVHTPKSSPYWITAATISPRDYSDSEDWDNDVKIKIKPEKDVLFQKPRLPARRSGFWADVMDTT